MKQRINQWKKMVNDGDPNAQTFLQQITEEAKAEGKIQEMSEVATFLMQSAADTMSVVEQQMKQYTMHQRLGNLAEVINLAYIARNYFGKTRQWLYQRLKGQTVNGKAATFTPAEEATFFGALNDIGLQISTFTHQSLKYQSSELIS